MNQTEDTELEPSLRAALRDPSVAARTTVYLRLLYSVRCAEVTRGLLSRDADGSLICSAMRAFLQTIDFDRLSIEQRARHRNLAQHFRKTCPSSFALLATEEQLPLLEKFCDSPDFWTGRGRTLAENFCLFMWRQLGAAAPSAVADLARLEGVIGGLVTRPGAATPWNDVGHSFGQTPAGAHFEQWTSPWHLLRTGQLPVSVQELSSVGPARAGGYRLTVTSAVGGDVTLECEPC